LAILEQPAGGCARIADVYPRAWIAQDFAEVERDGEAQPPEPWDGTGDMPPFARPYGHIDLGSGIGEEGEWETVEEAIAWARERVDVVLVRVGYSDYYSAGTVHPDSVPRR
jgi:hypothetical protein